MSRISSLASSTFTGNKQRNFIDLLAVLDHVEPIFVSREEFNGKDGKFLVPNGNVDSMGIFYDLYIPRDLMKGEQLELTLLLTEKFGLTEQSKEKIDELLWKIKILVAWVLRENWGKEFIEEAITKYWISHNTISRIEKVPIKVWNRLKDAERRDLIKIVQNRLEEIWGTTPLERKTVALEFGWEHFLEKELERVFFRKGLDMLRYGAMSMTAIEITTIKERILKNGYTLDKSDEQRDYWKWLPSDEGDDYVWTVMRNDVDYGSHAELLRKKMKIDEWKSKINEAKELWDKTSLEQVEVEASQFVLKTLQESYAYQTHTHTQVEWHNLVNIASKKEVQCFGFTILGHVFLSELGIKHFVISWIPQHVTLAVNIANDCYLFEWTSTKPLVPLKRHSNGWKSWYDVEIWGENYDVTFDDPEEAILEGIKHHIALKKDDY